MPSLRANVHSKNFSSACHQKGSFTTAVPTRTAHAGSSNSAVPPRTASSAVTPRSRPFRLTASRNGSGKVFSRPTRRPTRRGGARGLDIRAHHLLPVGPVVLPAGPEVEARVDDLLAQVLGQVHAVADVGVLAPGGDHLERHLP